MQRRKTAVTATVAGLVLTGSLAAIAAPSYADSASPTPSASAAPHAKAKGPKGDGAVRLCRRVPQLERRIAREIKRLNAGVGTPGSIARLEQRVANAKSANHTAIAKLLGDRLTARQALLPNLKQRQTDLKDVATWCAANNNGKPANGSTDNSGSAQS